MRRYVLTLAAYLLTLPVVAIIAFAVVLVLAGPHAGLLPRPLETVILVAGWLAVAALPAWVAVRVWRRVGRSRDVGPDGLPPTRRVPPR